MKIIELTAENFKKLKAVSIKPDSDVIQITGQNDEGKTTVLDCIWAAIDAAGYLKDSKTKEPIRQGEKKATIKLDLGELTITRKFLPSGATVEIATKDGAVYKSPQTILDALIGKISFDPLSFSMMDEKKQKEALLNLVNIDLDLTAHAAEREKHFNDRADVNRSIKLLEGQLFGIAVQPDTTPDEETKSETILESMRVAQETNESNQKKRDALDTLRAEARNFGPLMEKCDEAIEDLKEQIKALEIRISDKQVEKINIQQNLDKLIEKGKADAAEVEKLEDTPLDQFTADLTALEETNKAVRLKKQRAEITKSLEAETAKSVNLTQKLADLDKKKQDAIKAAVFPVPGMSFDDNGVLYNGVPFSQSGSAVRLRVSIAMAMSMNPKLRVIRIADGSLLDSKNMAIIEEMAKEHDYQLWIERVDESGKIGIVIEDGEIKVQKESPNV